MTQIAQSIPKQRSGLGSRLLLFVGAGMVVSLLVSVPILLKFPVRPTRLQVSTPPSSSGPVTPSSVNGDVTERVSDLGFELRSIPPEIASRLGHPQGGYISDVIPDGPAFRGGVRDGDILIGVGSLSISDRSLLRRCLDSIPPGGNVSLTIIRDRQERHILVVLPGPTDAPSVP